MISTIPKKIPVLTEENDIETIGQVVTAIIGLVEMPDENKDLIRKIKATIMEIKVALNKE